MTFNRTFVCLANSVKHFPSRCIAGKEWDGSAYAGWIRPVCDYETDEGAVPLHISKLPDRTQPQVLDVIRMCTAQPVPHGCQVENHEIAEGQWEKIGRVTWAQLEQLVDLQQDVWGSGNSSKGGYNDRLSREEADTKASSLLLIRPQNMRLVVSTTGQQYNNPKKGMRALFESNGIAYSLKVTDPRYTDGIAKYEEDKEYPLSNSLVCLSISEPLDNYHYKLIAAIFEPRHFE